MKKQILLIVAIGLLFESQAIVAQETKLNTKYITISINKSGYIKSIKDKITKKEYCPANDSSAILSLYKDKAYILPVSVKFDSPKSQMVLFYPNGSVATVRAEQKGKYLRFQLLSLTPRNGVDNIVWGPYKTNISKTIGEIISVVRDDKFAIGIMALDDNTTSGPPCDADMYELYYYIHSPDTSLYPLPNGMYEGKRFSTGGNGLSDMEYFSHPEEYYRINYGNGASLEPTFGSTITLHSRDRRKPQTIFYSLLPDYPELNARRHQIVDPVDVDFIGSGIAFYGCPDNLGLNTIENIVLAEGLPHPMVDGKWIKDPAAYRPDIAWGGVHDSLISYAKQIGFKAVQAEGIDQYFVNRGNRWAGTTVKFSNSSMPISEYTKLTNKEGIAFGLHTLTNFVQPHTSDMKPVPNDSLCAILRTTIINNIDVTDTIICVADTSYLNESGGWHDNKTNVLKLGKELIKYSGVTTTVPYTLMNIKRGQYSTFPTAHRSGDTISKLQPNCYAYLGFVPNMALQDKYADYYAHLLKDGGMNYIDFDGLESCVYQGHGHYSTKRFLRRLITKLTELGVPYLRIMGSCVYEGSWHYMSVFNIGCDNIDEKFAMFNPVSNTWGIEGKDLRYVCLSNYLPCTFGIVSFKPDWTVQVAENLQAKSVAWGATYMLGLNQDVAEKCPAKYEIFKTLRTWENARAANVFTEKQKEKMRLAENRFHLEQVDKNHWNLYPVLSNGGYGTPEILVGH